MCTAVTYKSKDFYFGRTLDVEFDCSPSVVIMPRNYKINLSNKSVINQHNAIIGMAIVVNNYPLYFDATNEKGLSMAGLNFPDNAYYFDEDNEKNNIAVSEIIPYILGTCNTTKDAEEKLTSINLTNALINKNLPNTPLHWIISDENKSITVEQTKKGMFIYDNPIGVLTNNPEFSWHLTNLTNYLNLTSSEPVNRMLDSIELKPYCRGLGAIGLPGDLSSPSRLIRATFTKFNSPTFDSEEESISQFFHILGSVGQTLGSAKAENGKLEHTLYTSCCNTTKGIYYYTTYFNNQINAIYLNKTPLNSESLTSYPLIRSQQINKVN